MSAGRTFLFAPWVSLVSLTAFGDALNTLPKVKSVVIKDCSGFPGYDASSGIANFVPVVSQSNSPVEGNGDDVQIVYDGNEGVDIVRFTIADDNKYTKYALSCAPSTNNSGTGSTQSYQIYGFTPKGVSGYSNNPLNLAPYPYDAELMWGVQGPAVQGYQHYRNGKLLPGVFLGSNGNTRWGIERVATGGPPDGRPYWTLRLIGGPGSKVSSGSNNATWVYPDEYKTFIALVG